MGQGKLDLLGLAENVIAPWPTGFFRQVKIGSGLPVAEESANGVLEPRPVDGPRHPQDRAVRPVDRMVKLSQRIAGEA